MLIEARDDEEGGGGMSDVQLRDEVMTLFLAGHETTANALAWTFHLLAQNPAADARMREELATVLGGRTPTAADVMRLPYTTRVFEESMRLYPPAWLVARRALHDEEFGGYVVPKGTMVGVAPYAIHRHPAFWPEPERFDPDRFLPERAEGRPKYAYFPFGGGQRLCIGIHFAMMEAVIILAMLSQRVRLATVPGHPVVPQALVTLRPKHGIKMTLSPA
jgi:cytochrome P450